MTLKTKKMKIEMDENTRDVIIAIAYLLFVAIIVYIAR